MATPVATLAIEGFDVHQPVLAGPDYLEPSTFFEAVEEFSEVLRFGLAHGVIVALRRGKITPGTRIGRK